MLKTGWLSAFEENTLAPSGNISQKHKKKHIILTYGVSISYYRSNLYVNICNDRQMKFTVLLIIEEKYNKGKIYG